MNEELIKKGMDITDQIVQGLKDAAPQMADLTLSAVKLQAMVSLGITIVWGLISIAALVGVVKLGYFLAEKAKQASDPFGPIFLGIITIPATFLIPSRIFLSHLFDTYMWAALVDPRVALAMRALDKVLTITNTK